MEKAPPRAAESCRPQTAPGNAAGMTSQAWVEQAAGPLLTDVISFDGPRLRLLFQLGLLEDSGRATVGLIEQIWDSLS